MAKKAKKPAKPAGRDLVVVHSSDIHVDDEYTARLYGGDGTKGLALVLEAARRAAADVVVLAGDTFENNRLPLALLDKAARLMADSGAEMVILPGNHDPLIRESAFHRGGFEDLPNVHVLGLTHDRAVPFPAMDLEIWGHAHIDYDDMTPLRRPRRRTTRWQIAIAHGHYEPAPDRRTVLRPSWLIGDRDITATGADYVALGHWNLAKRVGNCAVPAYYSGSPELAGTVNVVRLKNSGRVGVERRKIR